MNEGVQSSKFIQSFLTLPTQTLSFSKPVNYFRYICHLSAAFIKLNYSSISFFHLSVRNQHRKHIPSKTSSEAAGKFASLLKQ